MSTRFVSIHEDERSTLAAAARVLRRGGLVAFPTETVYGLGANALDPEAVGRIFKAKGRPATNPLIVHVATVEQAKELAADWPALAGKLAERFWPGPLTLVVKRGGTIPDIVTAGGPTVALRIPAHPIALALLRESNLPIAAPSANRSNQLSPTHAEHVLRDLDGRIDMILDGGPTAGGIESTVLDVTVSPPRLLRPGLIDPAAIEEIIGPIQRQVAAPSILPSPGMLARHYAPRTPLKAVEGDGLARVEELSREAKVAWLTWFDPPLVPSGVEVVRLPDDPAGYAALLYATLHRLDEGGFGHIIVALPPAGDAWLGVRDRLHRAGAR